MSRMARRVVAVTIAIGALVSCLEPATATRGQGTPVTIDCAADPGLLLDQPGRYRLTRGVEACMARAAVRITAEDVTLDLDGHTIGGTPSACTFGVLSTEDDTSVIRGAIGGCVNGLLAGDRLKAKQLRISNTSSAIEAANDAVVGSITISDSGIGVLLESSGQISRTVMTDVDQGVRVGTAATIRKSRFENVREAIASGDDALVEANGFRDVRTAISVTRRGLVIDNDIRETVTALACDSSNVVRGNIIEDASTGIACHSSNEISENTVARIHGPAISVAGSNLVDQNRVVESREGIVATFLGNEIFANTLLRNGGAGIRASGGFTGGLPTEVMDNVVRGNGVGIVVAGRGWSVDGNVVTSSRGDGLQLDPEDATSTVVIRNVSNANAGQGISLAGAVVPAGAGSNRARRNGLEPQCDGGLCG